MMTETHGIVLDFSHGTSAELDFAIVWYAHKLGWNGGVNDINQIVADWDDWEYGRTPSDYSDEEDFIISFREALGMACDDAVDWLNKTVAEDDSYYMIDDNSLYYWKDNGEDF